MSPGPTWWDCIESLNPCAQASSGICTNKVRQRSIELPNEYTSRRLTKEDANDLSFLLKQFFSVYPRCRTYLPVERIEQGLQNDWIAIGVFTETKSLIGCCVSRSLGLVKVPKGLVSDGGIVDWFSVHPSHRKKGIASFLLEELFYQTATHGRLVHFFLKEGFPLISLPPLYCGTYIVRTQKRTRKSSDLSLASSQLVHVDYLPLKQFIANIPTSFQQDSTVFIFTKETHTVFLCITDLHCRTVPEGKSIGELAWVLPMTPEVPLSIQIEAVETCIDTCHFSIVLMDSKIPHDGNKGWKQDSAYSWYSFNYRPETFFTSHPFWIM